MSDLKYADITDNIIHAAFEVLRRLENIAAVSDENKKFVLNMIDMVTYPL